MAPDLNSVPPSPRNTVRSPHTSSTSSRRASQHTSPPAALVASPASALSYPTRESLHAPPSTLPTSNSTMVVDNTGVGTGPGPLRHPRPLTAADLHLQLEKEQEAVVNRLTRELSLLRQQSASVVSTASSTSTGLADPTDQNANHMLSGSSHPTPSRRHRSSSSLSIRSMNPALGSGNGMSGGTVNTAPGISASTVSGIAPAREGTATMSSHARGTLSRQNSVASSRRSEASSPSLSSSLIQGDHFPASIPYRQSSSSQHGNMSGSQSSQPMSPGNTRSPTAPGAVVSARFEEATHHRAELEAAKRENEMLRRRIRDLERSLSSRRPSSDST